MTLTHLTDARTDGTPDPAEVIDVTLNGVTFRAGRRTAAHLTATDDMLRHRGCWLRVIQPCYNLGVSASAGTHDGDGCLDVEVVNENWLTSEELLRYAGWAAWYRTPPTFTRHIHMVSLGCPGPVGVFVPGQVEDYYAHRTGLAGHAADDTRHPVDIDSTVFDYPAWLEGQPMNDTDKQWLSDLIDAKLAANNTTLVKAVWDSAVNKSKDTARAALRKAAGL
jgi:hypothetical protein